MVKGESGDGSLLMAVPYSYGPLLGHAGARARGEEPGLAQAVDHAPASPLRPKWP